MVGESERLRDSLDLSISKSLWVRIRGTKCFLFETVLEKLMLKYGSLSLVLE